MYYELNEEEYLKIKEAEKTTLTNYSIKYLDEKKSIIPCEVFTEIINDLLWEIEELKQEKRDIEKDLKENYKPISPEEQYEV